MSEISIVDAQDVGGGNFFVRWAISQLFTGGVNAVWDAAVSGGIDYAGLAESQGTYYNMVGA